jgi:hypothetical protein
MSRKIISLFTLLAFIVFSISCYSWKKKEIRTAADWKGKKRKILSVVKTSGEYIEFAKDEPGQIYGDKITGTAVVLSKEVEITRDNIKRLKRYKKGMFSEITHKNGKIYQVIAGTIRVVSAEDYLTGKEEERIIFFATYETSESVIISLSEVKYIQAKGIHYGLLFLAVLGGIGLIDLLGNIMRNVRE